MNRNSVTDALILNCKQSGENNRLVTMLTRHAGIVRAVLYGGAKSRLRSLVSPYHTGKIWLYTDSAKHSIKITDFDALFFRPTFRENLYKSWAASLCAEITLATHSGGESADFEAIFTLVNGFLDGLDLSTEAESKIGLLRFLWRYLLFLGIQPDTETCTKCGTPFKTADKSTESTISFYSSLDLGFMCVPCSGEYTASVRNQFPVSEALRSYLKIINEKTPKEARLQSIDAHTIKEMQTLLFFLIEKAAGGTLHALEY